MNIIGIVCEFNPLHNGHKYLIDTVKKMYPDSQIVVALSGNITQRGEFSVLSKWDKTLLALNLGIDIVLEIPSSFAIQSADTFAYAALKLLNELKIDTLVFGSESNNIDLITKAAKIQINNSKFDKLVKSYLNDGNNYATSTSKAVYDLTNISIKESNDLLAISYIKEIIKNKYNIKPISIKRTNNFKEENNTSIISAYSIREKLSNKKSVNKYLPYNIKNHLLKIDYNKYFELLKYKILTSDLKTIHLVNDGIDNRLLKYINTSNNLNEFIEKVKTKRYTYVKINRVLMNIYFNINSKSNIDYIRILGLSKSGSNYLKSIKKNINLPIFNKYEKELASELNITRLISLITDKDLVTDEIKMHTILK